MKENKKTKIILIILMIIFGIGLIYSITNIIIWKIDNDHNKKQINNINKNINRKRKYFMANI